jgi:hypothetical protein
MAVKQVCPDVAFPSFDSIFNQLKGLKLSFDPNWPSLPTMPSPMFPNIKMPEWQTTNLAFNISVNQMLKWFEMIIGKLSSFLGSVFTFPDIPHINLKLPDLFNFSGETDWAAMFAKIPSLSLPSLPDPLLPNMRMPEFEGLIKFQALILDYMSSLMNSLIGLVDSVIGKLNAKPFQLGLSMPTLPDPLFPFNFESLMFSMPSLPSLPDPLFGNFNNSEMSLLERGKNYFLHLLSLIGKKIDDFVTSIASWIGGWTPPLICFGVPITVET